MEALRSAPRGGGVRGFDSGGLPDEAGHVGLQRPTFQEELVRVVHLKPGIRRVETEIDEQTIQR